MFLNTKTEIFPEFFFFPRLVLKGLVPYRDFFDHHGFLPYYLLSFLSSSASITPIIVFFHILQTANVLLVLYILRKITNFFWFMLCGFLYIIMNYFFSDRILWYEHFFVCLSLIAYILSVIFPDFKRKYMMEGFLIFLGSTLKPTFSLAVFPFVIYHKSLKPVLYFSVFWIAAASIMLLNRSFISYLESALLFNVNAGIYVNTYFIMGVEPGILKSTLLITCVSAVFYVLSYKKRYSILFFIFVPLIYFFQGYNKLHLLPFIPFFVILVAYTGSRYKNTPPWIAYLLLILVFTVFITRKVKHFFITVRNVPTYMHNTKINRCTQELKTGSPRLFSSVYFDAPEYYYIFNIQPRTFYVIWSDFFIFYRTGFQERIIRDIEDNRIQHLLLQNKFRQGRQPAVFYRYLEQKYRLDKVTACFAYYIRN